LPENAGKGRLAPDLRHWIGFDGDVIDLQAGGQRRRLLGRPRNLHWPFVGEDTVLTIDGVGFARLEPISPGPTVIVLAGHAAAVRDAAVTTDGRIVVTGGDDWHAVHWLAARGERLMRFSGHVGPVRQVAIASWTELVATLGEDATLRVWDQHSGAQLARFALAPGNHRVLEFKAARLLLAAPGNELIVLECEPCRSLPELKAMAEARLARLRDGAQETKASASAPR
jgi:WD40 repeat protein